MQHLLRQFSKTLGHENDLYHALLAELLRERKALMASDLVCVQKVVAAKKRLLQEIDRVEKKRLSLHRQIAGMLDCPVDGLSLSRMLARLSGPLKRQLYEVCAGMKDVLQRIRDSQRRNRLLVSHGLRLVSSSLDFLSRGPSACCVYRASGRLQYATGGGRLLSGSV